MLICQLIYIHNVMLLPQKCLIKSRTFTVETALERMNRLSRLVYVWISKYKVTNNHISKGFQESVMFVTRGVSVHDSKFGWLPLQRLFVRQSLETDFRPYPLKTKLV
jgi:hypothetical protein